jgi:hypothetical protein
MPKQGVVCIVLLPEGITILRLPLSVVVSFRCQKSCYQPGGRHTGVGIATKTKFFTVSDKIGHKILYNENAGSVRSRLER